MPALPRVWCRRSAGARRPTSDERSLHCYAGIWPTRPAPSFTSTAGLAWGDSKIRHWALGLGTRHWALGTSSGSEHPQHTAPSALRTPAPRTFRTQSLSLCARRVSLALLILGDAKRRLDLAW